MMSKLIDLTGKKFGRLTVIRREPRGKDKRGRPRWLCKCECGKEKVIDGEKLRNGNTKSCGCFRKEFNRLKLGLSSMRTSMLRYKINAKKRGIEFKLTEEQFKEITQKNCYYCGAEPSNINKNKKSYGGYIYNGIDRIDNTKGYTIDNVVPCCKHCNVAKNTFTLREFKDWIEKVYKKTCEVIK